MARNLARPPDGLYRAGHASGHRPGIANMASLSDCSPGARRGSSTDGISGHAGSGLESSVLKFAGMKPVRETLLGMVEAASDAKRQKWLNKMSDYGRRLA